MFKTSMLVVAPKTNFPLPKIFSMELNDVEKCSLCGMTFFSDSLTLSRKADSKWPWNAAIYLIRAETVSLKCGGTLIQSKAVLTAGNKYPMHSKVSNFSFL